MIYSGLSLATFIRKKCLSNRGYSSANVVFFGIHDVSDTDAYQPEMVHSQLPSKNARSQLLFWSSDFWASKNWFIWFCEVDIWNTF